MTDLQEPQPSPAPRRRRRGLRVLVVLLLTAVLTAAAGGAYAFWAMGGTADGRIVRVNVPRGASGAEIADRLAARGVIRSAFVFRLVARLRGVDADLKPGVYELRTGLGVDGVIDQLRRGIKPKFVRVVVPEGKTVKEIAAIVGESTHISAAAFLRAVERADPPAIVPAGVDSLEGFLFPKSYDIGEKATADFLVSMMLRQFERETASLDLRRARRFGLTPYEAVIVASLIEREARVAKERPLVASVIYNRLRRPMRLEIDATIQYVYIQRTGKPKHPLTFADYELVSPYNTYRIDGLPPTPIAAPGLASLQAALSPATSPYYFYVLKNEQGEHCFGRTLTEHQRCQAGR